MAFQVMTSSYNDSVFNLIAGSPRSAALRWPEHGEQKTPRGADRTPETAKTALFWPENCGAGPELDMENKKQSRYPIPRPGLLPGTKRQKPGTLR